MLRTGGQRHRPKAKKGGRRVFPLCLRCFIVVRVECQRVVVVVVC